MFFLRFVFCLLLLSLPGCQQSALVVYQQKITPHYLASTNVGSPDPRTPPSGQMIVAEWWVPKKLLAYQPSLKIDILFEDFTQGSVEFPIRSRVGYQTYSLLNKEFKKTGGLRAYRAAILSSDGEIYREWKHQLWVKLITVDEETAETSSSVEEKSRQGSVTETPNSKG